MHVYGLYLFLIQIVVYIISAILSYQSRHKNFLIPYTLNQYAYSPYCSLYISYGAD